MYIPEEEEIKKEKAKARQLRASQWWKRKCATGICHYCGRQVPPRELTMDHIVPLSRGGKTSRANVAPCCKECNTGKKGRLPMEWAGGG
ncbi:MAG: HNH endonuclease [Thermodesulfobacteriota bacterium]